MVEQVKYLKANVPQVKELYVVLLNDIHYGSNALDWGLHKRVFDFIDRNKENTRILINGDLFHNITKKQ
jgi:metallophosphoesterase superfamily enzyme